MAYNPKRPRPVLDDDDAPVEALIADENGVEDPVAVEAERQVIDLADRVASDDSIDDVAADVAADSAGGVAATSVEEPAGEPAPSPVASASGAASTATRGGSSVPVAPAPTEETANRAVAVATGAAAIITLIVLLLLRRRNRQQ